MKIQIYEAQSPIYEDWWEWLDMAIDFDAFVSGHELSNKWSKYFAKFKMALKPVRRKKEIKILGF